MARVRWPVCVAVMLSLAAVVGADPPPPPRDFFPVPPVPRRDHVHIFMVNGLTFFPHVLGSMNGVAPYLEQFGFQPPRVASHYWRWQFQDEIRKIHRDDPDASFVLVGYSIGAGVVHAMAEALAADGIAIDLMVYIDGHSFGPGFDRRPANVRRVVSINSAALALGGRAHAGEEAHRVNTPSHLAAPHLEETLNVLSEALNDLAAPDRPASPRQ